MTENSEVTVATGSKTTGETIIKVVDWDDCFPATIDDGPKFGGDGCRYRQSVQFSGSRLESVRVSRSLPVGERGAGVD